MFVFVNKKVKIENEKKYQDLAGELKKKTSLKMMVVPIIFKGLDFNNRVLRI